MINKRLKRLSLAVAAVVLIWMLGDFIYSAIIAARIRRWEATVRRDADGVQIGCREFVMGDGKDAILLLHGINDSPACYREMAKALSERGYTCRAMRLPGFAEPTEIYAQGEREFWLEAIGRELEALHKTHRRVFLGAHSLGGALTIRFLREHPQAADAAILMAPAVDVAADRSPLLPPETWHSIANCLLLFTKFTESPFGLDAKKLTDEEYPYRSPFAARPLFDQTFAIIRENRGKAQQLKTPLLMFLSPDDRVIDSEAASAYFEQVSSQPKRLHQIADTGHAMTVDHKWPELVDHIDSFLKEHFGEAPEQPNTTDQAPPHTVDGAESSVEDRPE